MAGTATFRTYDFIKDSTLIEYASATVTYFGYYVPHTPYSATATLDTSKKQFLILKQTTDGSGQPISIKWASRSYEHAWDDRAILNYY